MRITYDIAEIRIGHQIRQTNQVGHIIVGGVRCAFGDFNRIQWQ